MCRLRIPLEQFDFQESLKLLSHKDHNRHIMSVPQSGKQPKLPPLDPFLRVFALRCWWTIPGEERKLGRGWELSRVIWLRRDTGPGQCPRGVQVREGRCFQHRVSTLARKQIESPLSDLTHQSQHMGLVQTYSYFYQRLHGRVWPLIGVGWKRSGRSLVCGCLLRWPLTEGSLVDGELILFLNENKIICMPCLVD